MKKETLPSRFPLIFFFRATVVWLAIAVSALVGCGKKAPPLPPHANPVPPVTDLSCELQGSRAVLSWTIPDEVKQGAFGEGEVMISRARTRLTGELCPECPLAYERIAVLPISRAEGEPAPGYDEEVQPGFRFTYRVVLHMVSGRSSEPSNAAAFDYRDQNN